MCKEVRQGVGGKREERGAVQREDGTKTTFLRSWDMDFRSVSLSRRVSNAERVQRQDEQGSGSDGGVSEVVGCSTMLRKLSEFKAYTRH